MVILWRTEGWMAINMIATVVHWREKSMASGRDRETLNSSNKSGRAVDQDIKDKYKKGNKQ